MLHVSTITKNLVSVEQIVYQGIQVWFTHLKFYIEEEGQIIVQGRREGRMFNLDTNDVDITLFVKGEKVNSDIDLWHKGISHINYQRLQELQSKQVVFGLPKFSGGRPKYVKPAN